MGANYPWSPLLSIADLRQALHLDGDVRQVGKMRQTLSIVRRLTLGLRRDRDNSAEMAWPQSPEVQVGDAVALALDHALDLLGHVGVGHAVEQDGAGVADESDRPACDHKRTNEAGQRVHPEPAERPRQDQAHNDEHRDGGIGHDVNDRSPHVVVAMMPLMGMVTVVIMIVIVLMVVVMRIIMVVRVGV